MQSTVLNVPFRDGHTYCTLFGELSAKSVPLIVIHGGPGSPSYYLERLGAIARADRPVLVYDQVNVGRSTCTAPKSEWDFPLFIEQFVSLTNELSIDKADILGHSWGGFLVLEIALTHPQLFNKLVLSGTAPSAQIFGESAYELMLKMPAADVQVIQNCEAREDYLDTEYIEATRRYYEKHLVCTLPWPEDFKRSSRELNKEMYLHMWGPSEFTVIGTLKDWSVEDRLNEIECKTLVIAGEFDEAQPAVQKAMQSKIRNADLHIVQGAAHSALVDNFDDYQRAVTEFLDS